MDVPSNNADRASAFKQSWPTPNRRVQVEKAANRKQVVKGYKNVNPSTTNASRRTEADETCSHSQRSTQSVQQSIKLQSSKLKSLQRKNESKLLESTKHVRPSGKYVLPPMVLPSVYSGKSFNFHKMKLKKPPPPAVDPFHFSNAKALRRRASMEQQKIAQIRDNTK